MKNKIKSLIVIGVLLITLGISTHAQNISHSSEPIQHLTINYDFAPPSVEKQTYEGTTYDTVIIPGTEQIGNIGEPQLPMKSAYILLPKNTVVSDISITGEPHTLEGTYIIDIVRSNQKYSHQSTQNKQQTQYPSSLFKNSGTYQFRGYNILFLNLYPIQYLPQSGQLISYSSFDITISLRQTTQDRTYFRNLEKDTTTLSMLIDNPEIIRSYHSQEHYRTNQDGTDLLIITRDDLKQGYEPLATYHTNRGVNTIITTLSEIGAETPEDIKDYITSIYDSSGIEYVLIGSDVPGIPVHYAEAYNPALRTIESIPSDQWYGNIDDDFVSELAVGRACTDTLEEVDYFVSKTIQYLTDESIETYDRCLMVGQKLMALTFGGSYMDELINTCHNNDYTTEGIPEIRYHITKLYEKHENWEQTELVDTINQDNYHFINHLGHGHFYHLMKLDEPFKRTNQGELIPQSDVTDLIKNTKPFFLYSQACYSGSFDNRDDANNTYEEDCIGEYLTVKTDHAAFAAIMNSRYGLGTFIVTLGPSQFYNREFWDTVFEDDVHEIGKANQFSKIKNINRMMEYPELALDYCYWEISLFGDPTVPLKIPSIKYPYQPDQATFSGVNKTGQDLIFSTVSSDPNGDDLYYYFDWGDGTNTGWIGPYAGYEPVHASHAWNEEGNYLVRVKVKNINNYESQWSEPTSLSVPKTKHSNNELIYNLLRYLESYPFLSQLIQRVIETI